MPTVTDWLMVIVTTVYVIATIFICFFNAKAAKASIKQTEQMQYQFFSSNRPILTEEIIRLKDVAWALRFTNHGSQTAFNIKVLLDESTIENIREQPIKKLLHESVGKICNIGIGQSYDLFIGSNPMKGQSDLPDIKGKVIYNGLDNSVYAEDFDLKMQNYATDYYINSEFEDIRKELINMNKQLEKINNALLNLGDHKYM